MPLIRADVRLALSRLTDVWPALAKRDALRNEMGESIMRHALDLQPQDLDAGLTTLIEQSPTVTASGWITAPPGVHEVVGCILTAKRERLRAARPRRKDWGGMTFREWYESLPAEEQPKHLALARIMGNGQAT